VQGHRPLVEELADAYAGRLKVGKVNVDENMKVAASYQITAIPTLLIFKGGKVVQQIVGAVSKSKITEAIDRNL